MADPFSEIRSVRLRARFVPAKSGGTTQTIMTDPDAPLRDNEHLAKEWSFADDILNVSDTASVSIANPDGEVTGKFQIGQRVELEESDPNVANGQWIRVFTGRLTQIRNYTDIVGGSNLLLSMMDLGWHLTACHAKPLVSIRKRTFQQLLDLLIDPSWGFDRTQTIGSNDLNRRLKHGRQLILVGKRVQFGSVLPYVQVEVGQTPYDILALYARREGWLLNVGARGELIFFRPRYDTDPLYSLYFYGSDSDNTRRNNVVGTPTVTESIDGVVSAAQCFSTAVIPPQLENSTDPNQGYRSTVIAAMPNPLPFFRRKSFSDNEAITDQLRQNRATWEQQMGLFNSYTVEAEFPAHSQEGAFFVSDSMISCDAPPLGLSGVYYVQSVRRSLTLREGLRTRLVIRKPGLLNPELTALPSSYIGAGARKAAKNNPQSTKGSSK